MSTTANQSQAMDVMGARGYQAALAGVEWATFNIASQAVSAPAAWSGCATAAAIPLVLASFSVTVNCAATSAVEGVSTMWIYSVSSVARTTGALVGDLNYVEQIATATLIR